MQGERSYEETLKLLKNNELAWLSLIDYEIDHDKTTEIAEALNENTALLSLNLSQMCNGQKSCDNAIQIVRSLEGNTTLISLDLSNNHIDAAGTALIAEVLKGNTALKYLELDNIN